MWRLGAFPKMTENRRPHGIKYQSVQEGKDMGEMSQRIDLKKMFFFVLKRVWVMIICAGIGFAGMYCYTRYYIPDTYTASATMYVLNANPNLVNYQYANAGDLNTAVQLLDTYKVVVRSSKVMDVVVERLQPKYPGISASFISATISMGSVSDTGVLRISCCTGNAQLSADICNAVVDVAPPEIIRVVNAGSIEVIDYAEVPYGPDYRDPMKRGMLGAMTGAALAGAILVLLFLLNHKVMEADEITGAFTPPVLSSVVREKKKSKDPKDFVLDRDSPVFTSESYAKLRMNLLYTLVNKENKVLAITSAVSGEGKSTIAANLAIACAISGKRVLLIDGDMRRASQQAIFGYDKDLPGLSDVLIGNCKWWDAVLSDERENLHILPTGHLPPNPAELLALPETAELLAETQQQFDLVLLDLPPINIVSDPLMVSSHVAGCLLIVRQGYSDHREIKKALISAELTGMDVLGFVFYGEKVSQGSYYSKKYYHQKYYARKNG